MTSLNKNNEKLPKILYKYLPLKDLTHFYYRSANINTGLTENVIFFPNYRKLNDPKEGNNCNIILNKETIDKQENEHPLIKYLKLKYRILSLTKDCFNESMWDRYAGGYNSLNKTYEGICIGFKTNGEFKEAKKIEYVKKPEVKNITEKFDELKKYFEEDNISYEDEEYENLIKPLKEKIEESFFYKDEYWEKEEEYRIVKKRSFFIADSEKELELEFELIKCIFKKNNSEGFEKFIKNISEVKTTLTRNIDAKEKKTICPYEDLKKSYKKFIHDISKDEISKYLSEWLKDEDIEAIYSKSDDIKNSKLYKKFIENISKEEFKKFFENTSKEEFKKFVENTSKDKLFNDFISKLIDNSILKSLFYKIIYDKNKNSNEIINKIIEEIYKMNEKFKKENNYYNDFFKYSHEEIACLITGCDLEKKFTEINKKNTEHIQKYRDNFKNSFTEIFKKQKIETKELINEKEIEKIGEKIDKLLSSNENNNNNYLKMLKNITDIMKDVYKYKKYNSYGIFIPFCSYKVEDKNNKYEELRPHSPATNLDSYTLDTKFFYMHELNLKNQIIEIYGNEEDANEVLTALSKTYGKYLILSYYHSILNNEYHEFSDFFNEKFSGKDIKDIEIKVKNIENYKNNPEELEKNMKNFYKNHPEKLENIEEYSKEISKSINVLSKYEPKNDNPPSAFYFTFFILSYYNSLNLFFNNKTEKLEELKEQNKKFYENFKNKKFYKTIIGNGQIQLTNCITGKIIKNQEELEKDIENQEELEKDIEEDKKNKEPEVSLVKN